MCVIFEVKSYVYKCGKINKNMKILKRKDSAEKIPSLHIHYIAAA